VTHVASLATVHWQLPPTVTLAENEPPLTPTGWAPPPNVVDETVDLISPAVQGGGVGEAGEDLFPSPHVLLMAAASTKAHSRAPVR